MHICHSLLAGIRLNKSTKDILWYGSPINFCNGLQDADTLLDFTLRKKPPGNLTHKRDAGVLILLSYLADSGTMSGVRTTNSNGAVVMAVKRRQSPDQTAIHGVRHMANVKKVPILMLATNVRHLMPVYSRTVMESATLEANPIAYN